MNPDFWHNRWQRGETGWHQGEIDRHLRELWPGLGLAAGTRVLVPLCGKTLDLLWLAGQGHRVLGVELSRLGVESFFAENGLTPEATDDRPFRRYRVDEIELLCGDFFDLEPRHLDDVGAVYDRAALIALPPGLRARYAAHLDALLPVAVPRLLITLEYDQERMAGPPFAVHPEEVRALFSPRHRISQLAGLDALDQSPGLRARGLEALTERVYRLAPDR
jgi:thiopurine S-methyltransferase